MKIFSQISSIIYFFAGFAINNNSAAGRKFFSERPIRKLGHKDWPSLGLGRPVKENRGIAGGRFIG